MIKLKFTILDRIQEPQDLKNLSNTQLTMLAAEIRHFLLTHISKTGGHLSSNLGVVELTLALHYVFSVPKDKLIWDVGHQSYVHKIITGRKNGFSTLKKMNGMSGYPRVDESPYDLFNTGHSSTSIAAALGFAQARDLKKEEHSVIAVIGDGSLTGGLAFEALNNAGRLNSNLIVILNDNQMSISKNVGSLSKHLSEIRTQPKYIEAKEDIESLLKKIPRIGSQVAKTVEKAKESIKYFFIPGILFEEMGFTYLGPIDGHDIQGMVNVLNRAKIMKQPVFIHVKTVKGKGYPPAEKNPTRFHSVSPFDLVSGKPIALKKKITYSEVFGNTVVDLAAKDEKILGITAAMPEGTGLNHFKKQFPARFFDVGIAEQYAVTFSAGLAAAGYKPIVAIYSSFLQRAYDQILHDVCLQNLPVIFAIDRAGIVGADGETHQGIYDLSFLSHIPNLTVMAPKDKQELIQMLEFAVKWNGPIAIRYPRGEADTILENGTPVLYGKGERIISGKGVALISIGTMCGTAIKVRKLLKEDGVQASVINARFVSPLDEELIIDIAKENNYIFTIEDNIVAGGFGSKVKDLLYSHQLCNKVFHSFGFPKKFIEHGSRKLLFENYQLEADGIYSQIIKLIR